MCMNFSVLMVWILVTLALSCVLTVFVMLKLSCDDASELVFTPDNCLPSTNYTFFTQVCGDKLETLCEEGVNVGISFVVSLVFTLLIVVGIVLTLMVQGANYINARENMEYRRSYQPRNNSEYMMK